MTNFADDFKNKLEEAGQDIFDAGHMSGYALGYAQGVQDGVTSATDDYLPEAGSGDPAPVANAQEPPWLPDSKTIDFFRGDGSMVEQVGCGDPECPCQIQWSKEDDPVVTGRLVESEPWDGEQYCDDPDCPCQYLTEEIGTVTLPLSEDIFVVEDGPLYGQGVGSSLSDGEWRRMTQCVIDQLDEWAPKIEQDIDGLKDELFLELYPRLAEFVTATEDVIREQKVAIETLKGEQQADAVYLEALAARVADLEDWKASISDTVSENPLW